MVDPGRVLDLLERLEQECSHLRRLAGLSGEELAADPDRLAAVKYRFVVAIETCIDIGQHIIASEGLRTPRDFAEVFSVLQEGGFIPRDLVPRLQAMARFRNVLVHGYLRVEDSRVIEILATRLEDFDGFKAAVARSLPS